MIISGLQKMTLLDYPGRVACTVFLQGCNFRCPFCHNPALVTGNQNAAGMLAEDEVLSFLRKRTGLLEGRNSPCFSNLKNSPFYNIDIPSSEKRHHIFLFLCQTNE